MEGPPWPLVKMVNIFWSEFYCFFYQGRSRLEDYFHEFSQYEIPPEALPEIEQVWPLTQFFLFPFGKKIIDLPGGQINDPLIGETLFSVDPSSNFPASMLDPCKAF